MQLRSCNREHVRKKEIVINKYDIHVTANFLNNGLDSDYGGGGILNSAFLCH